MQNSFLQKIAFLSFFSIGTGVYAQKSLNFQEYVTVTMDMQGVLELKMSSDPVVDFTFNTIEKYQTGITKYNSTVLEVNSTVGWDLYVQPATQFWQQQMSYSTTGLGQVNLPSEILELQCVQQNYSDNAQNLNVFSGLASVFGSNTASAFPTSKTQFLSGHFGTSGSLLRTSNEINRNVRPNNRFSVNYRIKPGIPAVFPDLSKQYPSVAKAAFPSAGMSAQPGYYELEIVYSLVEDL
jgi:hypothetical protein